MAYAKGPQPERPANSGGFAWGQGALPSIPNNPQAGQTFEGFTPNGSRVWFTGEVGGNYLPEVERFNAGTQRFESGALQPDGTVSWKSTPASKVPSIVVPPPTQAPGQPPAERLAPLPTHRSLVPYGDGPKHWERQAEWSNQSEERLRRAVTAFKQNPTRALVTSDGTKLEWKTVPGSGIAGDGTTMDYNRILGHFSTQAIAWGISMGVIALVIWSSPQYVNDPLVLQKYVDTLKGPVGWLGFIGFAIGYGLVYSRFVSNAPYAGVMKRLPGFMAALLAGTAVQFGISALARDPVIRSCIGVPGYEATGYPIPNLDACQKSFESDQMSNLVGKTLKEFIPAVIATTFVGISYFALYPHAAQFFKNTKIGGAIVEAGTQAGARGGLLRIGLPVAITTAMMWATQPQQQWLADRLKEWWASRGRWQSGPYAETLGRAEDDLYTTWAAMKKVGFSNPAPIARAKKVCYEANRVGAPYHDCTEPALDFEGVLKAYGDQQNGWRAIMLEPSTNAMGAWYQKTLAYKSNLNSAHDWYKLALQKIAWTKTHPNAPATDERVFNAANMLKAGGEAWGTRAAIDGSWRNLATRTWNEFFMTSLACGPETEGSNERGLFGSARRLVSKYVTGYASPDRVIEDMKGWKTKFHPPRITEALMDSHETVCDNRSVANHGSDAFWKWVPTNGWTPVDLLIDTSTKTSADNFFIRSQGVDYKGIPEYVLANVRPSLVSIEGDNFFERWWAQNVGRLDVEFDQRLDRDYKKMLIKTHLPIMNSTEYFWCEPHALTRRTGLEKYLTDLANPNGQTCGAYRTHRIARGVTVGLIDEARLYAAMMMDLFANSGEAFRTEKALNDLHLTDKTRVIQFEGEVRPAAVEAMRALEKFSVIAAQPLETKDRKAAMDVVEEALNKFGDAVFPAATLEAPKTDQVKRQREMMAKLFAAYVNVASSLATYLELGASARVTTPPVWVEIK